MHLIDPKISLTLKKIFGDPAKYIEEYLYGILFKEKYSRVEKYLSNVKENSEEHDLLCSHLKRLIIPTVDENLRYTIYHRKRYERETERKVRIVVWYGKGTNGKTALIRKLGAERLNSHSFRFQRNGEPEVYVVEPINKTPWYNAYQWHGHEIYMLKNTLIFMANHKPPNDNYDELIEFPITFSKVPEVPILPISFAKELYKGTKTSDDGLIGEMNTQILTEYLMFKK